MLCYSVNIFLYVNYTLRAFFFHVNIFVVVTPSAENKCNQPFSSPSDELQIHFTVELLQQVNLNTRFAICIKGNIVQGDLHLWNKKVVMFQHLLFDDTGHHGLDDPGIFIEQ